MIDLHIHTNYSDGADSLIDVLKKCEERKLTYISITDHDTCNAYKELKKINVKDYYSGTIIPGVEIKCGYKGRLIEILGYKLDTDKFQDWADVYYKDKSKAKLQRKYFDILCERMKEMGLKLDEEVLEKFDSQTNWASVYLYREISRYEENKKFFPEGTLDTFDDFSKKYCGDRNSKLYIDKSKDYPTLEEGIEIVRKCNGLVFFPHLFIYKWATNKEEFIDELLAEYKVDGIECMHSEFNQEQIDYLLKLTEERNYLRSGGSDYHGKNKVGIDLAIGKGNLKIPEFFVEQWI